MPEFTSHGDHPSDQQAVFTTGSWLLARPRLAHLYTELLLLDEWTPTSDLVEATEFSQSTVYDDLAALRETSLVTVRTEGRERHYRAEPFKIGVITAGQLTTITPTIVAAVGRQAVDDDVAQFVDDYGIEKLVEVVAYVKPYIDGRMTERIAARELGLPTLVGTAILIALEEPVRAMQAVDPFFADVRDTTAEGEQPPAHEIRFDEHTRVIFEPKDETDHGDIGATDPGVVPGIDRTPDKQGGEPCVAGTRVPVRRIGHLVERDEVAPSEVAERYDLSLSDVHRALAYYYDQPDEMQQYDQRDCDTEGAATTAETETFEKARDRLQDGS